MNRSERTQLNISEKSSTDADPPADQDTLTALLLRTGQGDRDAFTAFYKQTSHRVYSLARRTIVNVELSKDATQDIYLTVWRDAHTYDPILGSPLAWLMTIAHRKSVDKVRTEQAGTNRQARWAAETQGTECDVVAETVEARSEAQTVMESLTTLTPVQREAIYLAYYNCLTYREVAEQLSVPLPTVKTRIRSGLIQLRTCLAGSGLNG